MQGTVMAWGDNSNGQLGNGSTVSRATPGEVPGVRETVALEAGCGHVLALLADGTVLGWGRNGFGQACGLTTDTQTKPQQVPGLARVKSLAPGGGHSLVLRDDGTVWGWGAGFFGMLGDLSLGVQPVPGRVPGLEGVVKVVAGGSHNLALTVDGSVWSWGRDDHGQLGDGADTGRPGRRTVEYRGQSFACRTTPAKVEDLSDVRDVAAGGGHSLALLGDGSVFAWGYNDRGQLGDGAGADRATPAPALGLTGVRALAAGYHHTVAVRDDGSVWACGLNDGGQCGDGSTAHRAVCVQATGVGEAVSIAANGGGTDVDPGNGGHSLALRADGTVLAWGYNDFGQLGDGSTVNRLTAVEVKGLSGISRVTAGGEVPQFRENPGGGYALALR